MKLKVFEVDESMPFYTDEVSPNKITPYLTSDMVVINDKLYAVVNRVFSLDDGEIQLTVEED